MESCYHGPARAAGTAGVSSNLLWSSSCPDCCFGGLLGKTVFAWVPRYINTGKMLKIILSWALLLKMGKLGSREKGWPSFSQHQESKLLEMFPRTPLVGIGPHLAAFQHLWTFSLISTCSGWTVAPKRYVHLEPQNVILFRKKKKVFSDVFKLSILRWHHPRCRMGPIYND